MSSFIAPLKLRRVYGRTRGQTWWVWGILFLTFFVWQGRVGWESSLPGPSLSKHFMVVQKEVKRWHYNKVQKNTFHGRGQNLSLLWPLLFHSFITVAPRPYDSQGPYLDPCCIAPPPGSSSQRHCCDPDASTLKGRFSLGLPCRAFCKTFSNQAFPFLDNPIRPKLRTFFTPKMSRLTIENKTQVLPSWVCEKRFIFIHLTNQKPLNRRLVFLLGCRVEAGLR